MGLENPLSGDTYRHWMQQGTKALQTIWHFSRKGFLMFSVSIVGMEREI